MSNILANNINPRSGNKITIGNVNTTVAIAGTATYEDVSSIDSVGVITARSGVNVTGGSVGIGTDNPATPLEVQASNLPVTIRRNSDAGDFIYFRNNNFYNVIGGDNGSLYFKTNGTAGGDERLRITSTGDVGINCTPHSNAGINLHIHGDNTTSEIRLTNTTTGTGNNGSYIQQGGNTLYIGNSESGNVIVENNGAERLRVTSAGDMGLGTATPTSFGPTFQVAGTDPALLLQDTATAVDYFGINVTSGISQLWYDDAAAFTINTASAISGSGLAEKLRIASNGNITIGTASNPGGKLFFESSSGSAQCIRSGGTNNQNLIFGTASTEYLLITSGGDVRITNGDLVVGETTESNAGSQYISVGSITSGAGGIQLWGNPTNGNSFIQFGDGTASASHYRGYINYRHADDGLRFGTAGSDRVMITSAGKVLINSTTNGSSADLQVGATGASIALGGDASANGTGRLKFLCSNSTHNWQISTNDTIGGALEFAKSSSAGGSSFSSPSMVIKSDGNIDYYGGTFSFENSGGTVLQVVQSGVAYKQLELRTSTLVIGTGTGSASERLRINSGGQISIANNIRTLQRGYFDTATSSQNASNCPDMAGILSYSFGYQEAYSTSSGSWVSPYPDLVLGYHTGVQIGGYYGYGGTRFFNDQPSRNVSLLMSVGNGSQNVVVVNSLSKGGGTFRIAHPHPSKKWTHDLQHSFIEGPQCDNLYRGRVDLVDGTASINIDTASNMTDGTFVLLNRDIQCFTSNETGWDPVKGSVSGNILTITSQNNSSTDTISWMVMGERQDDKIKSPEMEMTDSDGKLIVEPLTIEESHM